MERRRAELQGARRVFKQAPRLSPFLFFAHGGGRNLKDSQSVEKKSWRIVHVWDLGIRTLAKGITEPSNKIKVLHR